MSISSRIKFELAAIAAAASLTAPLPGAAQPAQSTPAGDWKEAYAYSLGIQAVIYGYPMMRDVMGRYGMVERPVGVVSGAVNGWFHLPRLANADDKYGASVIDNLLYSVAWFDVAKEPLVVTVPAAGESYYSIQMMEMYTDIFGYLGQRATGNKAGSYLLVGPDWQGELPRGITALRRSPTPTGMLLMRIQPDSRNDLAAAKALQAQTQLAPLSAWLAGKPYVAGQRDVIDPVPPQSGDPYWFFKTINRGMVESPPPPKDAALVAGFAAIGVGPKQGENFAALDASTQSGLKRAFKDGMDIVTKAAVSGGNAKVVNQWAYGQMNWGRTAQDNDFLTRASTQAHAGWQEHHVEEVVKLRAHQDGDGRPLDGTTGRYVLRFEPGQTPKAKALWSVTLYDARYDLVANALNRYSLGSAEAGQMTLGKDGSLEIYIQAEPPSADQMANWLPAPKSPFNLFLRTYLPGQDLIDQSYVPPPVRREP